MSNPLDGIQIPDLSQLGSNVDNAMAQGSMPHAHLFMHNGTYEYCTEPGETCNAPKVGRAIKHEARWEAQGSVMSVEFPSDGTNTTVHAYAIPDSKGTPSVTITLYDRRPPWAHKS